MGDQRASDHDTDPGGPGELSEPRGNPERVASGETGPDILLPPLQVSMPGAAANVRIDQPSISLVGIDPEQLDIETITLVLDAAAEAAGVQLLITTDSGAELFEARPAGAPTEDGGRKVPIELPGSEQTLWLFGPLPQRKLERIAQAVSHSARLRRATGAREHALDAERQRLELVFDFSEKVNQLAAVDDVINRFLGDITRILGAREGTFFAVDPRRHDLFIRCHHGSSEEVVRDFRLKVGEGIAGAVAKDGRPRIVNDAEACPEYVEKNNPIRNIICAPVSVREKLIGVVNVNDRAEGDTPFSNRDLQLLASLARLGGVALDNARLYSEVRELLLGTVDALVGAIDAKAELFRGHSRRVAFLCSALAERLGADEEERDRIRIAALLHDVGNLAISGTILGKPGPLDEREAARVKEHPALGAQLLSPVQQLADALPGILDHHERYDGRGYPRRLKGEEISLQGRLVAIAEAFDAITHDRPHRKASSPATAKREITVNAGTQFDPALVPIFEDVYRRLDLDNVPIEELLPSTEPELDF